jgi:hypothetical protein
VRVDTVAVAVGRVAGELLRRFPIQSDSRFWGSSSARDFLPVVCHQEVLQILGELVDEPCTDVGHGTAAELCEPSGDVQLGVHFDAGLVIAFGVQRGGHDSCGGSLARVRFSLRIEHHPHGVAIEFPPPPGGVLTGKPFRTALFGYPVGYMADPRFPNHNQ